MIQRVVSIRLLSISALWLALISAGCNVPENISRSEQPSSTPTASTTTPNAASDIDRVLGIPAGFKPVYKVLEVKDVSTATALRKVVHVSLPKGATKETIESNLRYAAKEQYEKEKPDAIEVHGYLEGRTIDASNVLGSLIFAPYGDWARASEKPSFDKYKAVFKDRNPYLPPIDEEASDTNDSLEKQALAGDYQAQRNLAYYLSTGAEGHAQNSIMACAWRIVIAGHAKADASDVSNKTFDCERKLNSQQMREAEAQANALMKKIKKR
jgi:hypothetical protein